MSEGKRIYANRMPLTERTFAEVKHVVGFRRFLRRGLRMVQLEWGTTCIAINIRRMFTLSRQHQG